MDWKENKMTIYYISNGISPSMCGEFLKKYNNNIAQQAQKYNRLLSEGIAQNGAEVIHISTRPINRRIERKVFFKRKREEENGVKYHYIAFLNLPILRNISILIGVFLKLLKAPKDTVVICDALNISASMATLKATHIRRLKNMAIVTDVPEHRPIKVSTDKKCLKLMRKYDSYLLLTEQMSSVVNPNNKPYIVLEGNSDFDMKDRPNTLDDKANPKVCMYAGQLRAIYGIDYLVKGFIAANIENVELHVYGNGNYSEELMAICKEHSNVKYFGSLPNNEIVKKEIEATLLVNPRPTNEEYTKYSFPSKNMEYMASGTPILTTNLPGMPKEYHEYVFLINDETEEGIKTVLKEIFELSPEELHKKGERAKDFVIKNKNNIEQAKKLLEFVKNG